MAPAAHKIAALSVIGSNVSSALSSHPTGGLEAGLAELGGGVWTCSTLAPPESCPLMIPGTSLPLGIIVTMRPSLSDSLPLSIASTKVARLAISQICQQNLSF